MKISESLSVLNAISPLDGRYASRCDGLRPLLSEAGFMAHRVEVEIAWLVGLSDAGLPELPPFSSDARAVLRQIVDEFSEADAGRIKQIERKTNHDVKAVEYWLKEKVADHPELARAAEFIHFACTSEDINNTSHALMLGRARDRVVLPQLNRLIASLASIAHAQAAQPMLARTHGQPATPTTLGKEFANVVARLRDAQAAIAAVVPLAKMNGATGNYNAHMSAYPEIDWAAFSARVLGQLGLKQNPRTIQIEPHDWMAEYFDALARCNTVLLDLCRDFWGYISLGYFRQKVVAGEVGSSTMPHKVNPIDFENGEGNFGVANALLRFMADKLPVSRWQRDLTDSTVQRNIGVALAHSDIAIQSVSRGLARLEVDRERLQADLDANWELLAEPIQTVMRRHAVPEAYEQLKALTRGRRFDAAAVAAFVRGLPIPHADKQRLLELTPATYLGLAARLARGV